MENSKGKILVVDDNVDMLNFFQKALEREGYTIIQAKNGLEALEILQNEDGINLILSDIKMPIKSGIDILKEVKTKYPSIKVVLITGYAQIEEYLQAMEYGAYEYLMKPIRVSDLLTCVNRALSQLDFKPYIR